MKSSTEKFFISREKFIDTLHLKISHYKENIAKSFDDQIKVKYDSTCENIIRDETTGQLRRIVNR